MTARKLFVRSAFSLLVLATASSALADDVAGATERFKRGTEAFARGEYAAAASAFEDANRLAPRGAALHNAALSWEALGEIGRAADTFAAALQRSDFHDPQRSEASAHLEALRKRVGRLRLDAPAHAQVSVAHVQRAPASSVIHLSPGSHSVAITFEDGTTLTRPVTIRAGEEVVETVRPTGSPEETRSPPAEGRPDAPPPFFTTPRVVGFVSLGVSAVCAFTAAFTWSQAHDALDEFDRSGQTDRDAHDRAGTMETLTNVAWSGAAVFALTGGALLLASFLAPSWGTTAAARPGGLGLVHRF